MTAAWFRVEADAEEPLVMSSGEHSRNRAATHPFVTGSALRGAVATRWLREQGYLRRNGGRATPLAGAERERFLAVFESGRLRFPTLVQREVPPLSLHSCKAEPDHLVDLAAPEWRNRERVVCDECGAELRRASVDLPARPVVRTRTAIGDDGVAARGMLYAQEELPEGSRFWGYLVAAEDTLDILTPFLPLGEPFDVVVGGDRSTSGRLSVTISPARDPRPSITNRLTAWLEAGGEEDEVLMTATSALILTDQWLRPGTRFTSALLAPLLAVDDPPTVRRYTAARTREAGGWNPGAGLPKPTDIALVEGSVVTMRVDGQAAGELAGRLRELEEEGIGWRRAEGFGAVTFWDPRHLNAAAGSGR